MKLASLPRLGDLSVSRRTLARAMAVLFFASLLPLIVIALYNYPADDDFGFVLPAAAAWVQTGSLWEVLRAIAQKTYDTYMTWQGNFVSTALFAFTPMVFDIRLYFLSNWINLALLCLSVAYLVKGAACVWLKADRDTFWIVYGAVMILVLQFMPAIGYSIYWHNGGGYTVTACLLFLLLGLFFRAEQTQSRRRRVVRTALCALLGFALGGCFFGPMLGALVLLVLVAASAFQAGLPHRRQALWALAFFAVSLIISVSAPGNAVRLGLNGEPMNPFAAVITAALESFDLAGAWLSPQVFGMLLLILPAMWKPLRESACGFRHPVLVFIMLYGLFSAALAPGIYTHSGYDTERYLNALYFYFLIAAIGSAVYWEGAFIRWLERAKDGGQPRFPALSQAIGRRYAAALLALVILLTGLGGFAFTIMNTSSISATKSLLTGEAALFRQEMAQRQEYIRVTPSDETAVRALSGQPYVFKYDRLPFQGIYGRVRYMKMYFELFHNAR